MNRLTKYVASGKAVMKNTEDNDPHIQATVETIDLLKAIFTKLAAYEDTGLDPEQIVELINASQQDHL